MINELKVGAQVLAAGAINTARGDRMGCAVVTDGHGRYNEAVLSGNVYIGANLGGTAVTTQAGLSATTPALTLYNPVGSGKYLSLLRVQVNINASPAAAANVMLANNTAAAAAPGTVTNATILNALIGNLSIGVANCYRIATLAAAPIAFYFLGGTTGALAIGGFTIDEDTAGSVIIVPGVAVSIQTTSAAVVLAAFTWEEITI